MKRRLKQDTSCEYVLIGPSFEKTQEEIFYIIIISVTFVDNVTMSSSSTSSSLDITVITLSNGDKGKRWFEMTKKRRGKGKGKKGKERKGKYIYATDDGTILTNRWHIVSSLTYRQLRISLTKKSATGRGICEGRNREKLQRAGSKIKVVSPPLVLLSNEQSSFFE